MEDSSIEIFRLLGAMAAVLGLMGGFYLIMKKLGLSATASVTRRRSRLKLVEVLPLDARRRLALIQRDNIQHLVILGQSDETVIETGIRVPDQDKLGDNENAATTPL